MNRVSSLNILGHNRVLAGLPRHAFDRLLAQTQPVPLIVRQAIYEANKPIPYIYFPLSGVVSVVIDMAEGLPVEVGTIGNEGMAGTPAFLGAKSSRYRSFTQVAGEALRMKAGAFQKEIEHNGHFLDRVRRHTQAWLAQVSQSAGCNMRHAIEQRMCRWLLMTHDRVGMDEFQLTQEFLAQMLGVRRPSVTVVAGMLQRAGLISYHRGIISILDRHELENASCECYQVVRDEYLRLLG